MIEVIFSAMVVMAVGGIGVVFYRMASPPKIASTPVLYAKKGEVITCTNGHKICELANDIYIGGMLVAEELINWENQEPAKPHDEVTPCKTCGEPFIKQLSSHGGSQLHIGGEWRTMRSPQTYG